MTELFIGYVETGVEIAKVWGPLIVLFFMTVESSFVPFPSEVVMIPAGFMAARGEFFPGDPMLAVTVAVMCGLAGSLLGAWINYYLSRRLGRPFLYTYGKYFFLKPEALQRAEEIFREYGDVATFVCRLLPAIRQLISIPAGLSRMHFGRFSLFTGLGAGIWMVVLAGMGYWAGFNHADWSYSQLVHHYKGMLTDNLIWVVLGCAIIMGTYILVHKRVMHGKAHTPPPASA